MRLKFLLITFLMNIAILFQSSIFAQTTSIEINSNFDSGNLRPAVKIAEKEYNIELEPHNDAAVWFHFRVTNCKDSTITFHLLNGINESIWNYLHPAISYDWQNWENIFTHSYNGSVFTFTHTFTQDTAYISTHPAFNTAMMDAYLDEIETHPKVTYRSTVAHSVQGRPVDAVVLTDPAYADSTKLGVFLISRQHASELAGWFVLQGLMNWLLSDQTHAVEVMKHMVFNIVPMMNPDGVYLGKYRTTSLNIDLNRQWDNASPTTEPSVYVVTQMVQSWVNSGKDFSFFTDFHATKNGRTCFIYQASESLIPSFITQNYYDNQLTFINLIQTNCPLINTNYSSSISTSSSTLVSRQYMIANYQHLNDKFLALLYEGVNVPVSYGTYTNQPMTIEIEHATGRGFGESIYSHYVEPLLLLPEKKKIPEQYDLVHVYPNPFNSTAIFSFRLAKASEVSIEIYDSLGKKIETLTNKKYLPGKYNIKWNADNFSSGVYHYKYFSGKKSDSGKFVLIK